MATDSSWSNHSLFKTSLLWHGSGPGVKVFLLVAVAEAIVEVQGAVWTPVMPRGADADLRHRTSLALCWKRVRRKTRRAGMVVRVDGEKKQVVGGSSDSTELHPPRAMTLLRAKKGVRLSFDRTGLSQGHVWLCRERVDLAKHRVDLEKQGAWSMHLSHKARKASRDLPPLPWTPRYAR